MKKIFNYLIMIILVMNMSIIVTKAIDKPLEDGYYYIGSKLKNNMLIDVDGAKTNNGTNIQIWQYNYNDAQKWYFESDDDGYYTIKSKLNSNKCLNVSNNLYSDGINIQLWDCNNSDSQKFTINDLEDGYFNIITKIDNYMIDIDGAKTNNGTNVQLWHNNGNDAQVFKIEKLKTYAPQKVLDDGYYSIKSKLKNNMLLDVKETKTYNGTNVYIWQHNYSNSQKWYFESDDDGYYRIKTKLNSNKCLDVSNAKYAAGNNIQIWDCNGNDAQKFIINDLGDGYFNIVTKIDNYMIDIDGAKTNNGTNIQLWYDNGNDAQAFTIEEVKKYSPQKSIEDGYYYIKSKLKNNMLLDVNGAKTNNGTNVQLYQFNYNNAQKWYFESYEDGYYTIKTKLNSNKCLDVSNAKYAAGNNIQIWDCNGNDAQKFIINDLGDGYFNIVTKIDNYMIDIDGAKTNNGTNVQLWYDNGNNAQIFTIEEVKKYTPQKVLEDGYYSIKSKLKDNMLLDVKGAKTNNGTNVQLYQYNNNNAQKWYFESDEDGYYRIKTKLNSNKCLDVSNAKYFAGNNIQIWDCNGNDAQKFIINDLGDGYFNIVTKIDNYMIDIDGVKTNNSTNIQLWYDNGNDAQVFTIEEIEFVDLANDVYSIASAINQNYLIDVQEAKIAEATNVQTYSSNGHKAQKWYISKTSNNYYTINSGLYSIYHLNQDNNNIQISRNNIEWEIQYYKNNLFYIKLKNTDLYLTLDSNDVKNNTNVSLKPFLDSDTQRFVFLTTNIDRKLDINFTKNYLLESKLDSNKVIDVSEALNFNGTNIQIYQKNNNNAQVWKLNSMGNGIYNISSAMNPNIVLDLKNGSIDNKNNIQIYRFNNSNAQKWNIIDNGDGSVSFKSIIGNSYIDVDGARTANGTNIQIYQQNNNNAQKFILKEYNNIKVYKGIDVSSWQSDIDWYKVANSGVDFAVLRMGWGDDLERQDDSKFIRNVEECEKYNIPYAVYLYSYAMVYYPTNQDLNLSQDAIYSEIDHAKRLLNKLKELGYRPTLKVSIYYDIEDNSQISLGKDTITDFTDIFCNGLTSSGYNCGFYANRYWLNNLLDTQELVKKYPLWLASWDGQTTFNEAINSAANYSLTGYKLWQFTSTGKVNGISGNVDLDIGYDIFD